MVHARALSKAGALSEGATRSAAGAAGVLSEATLRARLGDAIPEMIDVVVARLGELGPPGLVDAIVSDPADAALVARLAGAAGWTLPTQVAVVVLGSQPAPSAPPPLPALTTLPGLTLQGPPLPGPPLPGPPHQGPPLQGLPRDTLADWIRPEPVLVLPDPAGPGRAATIDRALCGRCAAIGPAVPLAHAARSLRLARQALALSRRGILCGDPVRCEEHLSTLLLLADVDLARALLRSRLAPLDRMRPGQQDRVARTMLAWLELGASTVDVARHMNVHPQTVRYRLRQVVELFGDELRDPQRRFELMLALRIRDILTQAPPLRPGTA